MTAVRKARRRTRSTWLGAAFGLVIACDQSRSPLNAPPATSAPLIVQRGPLDDRMVLTGELEATHAERLPVPRTPNWAVTLSWLVEDGTAVKKGAKVVEFDSSALADTLQEKRDTILRIDNEMAGALAKSSADRAEKTMLVERARADVEKKTLDASVPADLEPAGEHQQKQLTLVEAREHLVKTAEELVAQRRTAQLERAVQEVDRGRAVRDLSELEKRLEELTLRAPRDGMVQLLVNPFVGRKYQVGDETYPGMVVAALPELGSMQVNARLSDVDDGAVRTGMAAECILDAYPHVRFKGTVQAVSLMAHSAGHDAARRFFDVLVAFAGAPASVMRPGMSARVEVIRRQVPTALLVPRAALRGWPGKSQVRRLGGELLPVEVNFCSELACAVQEGLVEGTQLAPAGAPEKGS